MSKIVCSVCGSGDVQTKVWAKPNENYALTSDFTDELIAEPADCWCCVCEKNQKLIVVDDNYVHVPPPPKEKTKQPQYYTCPNCCKETLKYAMINLDGTNLEEGYCCNECNDHFIGLDNAQVLEFNPEINEE